MGSRGGEDAANGSRSAFLARMLYVLLSRHSPPCSTSKAYSWTLPSEVTAISRRLALCATPCAPAPPVRNLYRGRAGNVGTSGVHVDGAL